MLYQIDQSGKIEHTNRPTVLTLANGEVFSIKISSIEKQKLISALRQMNRPNKTYVFQIFAVLIFVLLRKLGPAVVVVDQEYPGHDTSIKEILSQLFDSQKAKPPEISFGLVGKNCQAHKIGLEIFQRKRQANIVVSASEVLEIVLKNKKWSETPL